MYMVCDFAEILPIPLLSIMIQINISLENLAVGKSVCLAVHSKHCRTQSISIVGIYHESLGKTKFL